MHELNNRIRAFVAIKEIKWLGQNMIYNGGANSIAVGDNIIVKSRRKTVFQS